MSIISSFLNQRITYIKDESVDGYGTRTLTTLYSDVPCRVIHKHGVILTNSNLQKEYKVEVWLLPDYNIQIDYQFIISGETLKVLAIEDRRDLGGVLDHQKVYLS